MSGKKKQQNRGEDFKQEDVLQAVVIGDSFDVRFAPLTENRPRCLLPLVNIPLLDYTLECLCASGIQETYVFCCAHSEQIKNHIMTSRWSEACGGMEVHTIVSDTCMSMGDALRDIDAKSVIHNDFVLVNGDLVANVKLKTLIQQHKDRRLRDKTPIMTMLFKRAPPGHRTRSWEDEMVLVTRTDNAQVLSAQLLANSTKLNLPLELLEAHPNIDLHYDLVDCQISICSPHVPQLFTDEFDYLTRDHFVKGILEHEEILGHTIHIHVIEEEYAARVSNLHMYDSISQDVLSRWSYPLVPDGTVASSLPQDKYSYGRHNIYMHKDVTLARGCVLEENVAIGEGSRVGSNSHITRSVIGKHCTIGENVRLENAYILDHVTIGDNCVVTTALLDDCVTLSEGVKIHAGCVLGKKVAIGKGITLKPATKLTSTPPQDDFSDTPATPAYKCELGCAYEYKESTDSDDEVDDLADLVWGLHVESEETSGDDWESSEGESEVGSGEEGIDDMVGQGEGPTESDMFYDEVIGTLERAMTEDIGLENMILEVNSLKHAYGIQIGEVNSLVTKAVLELPVRDNPDLAPQNYLNTLKQNFKKMLPLLQNYIRNAESQQTCLMSIEDLCLTQDVLMQVLVKVIHYLYETEVLSEEVILAWFKQAPSKGDNIPRRQQCRKEITSFVTWLEEAEEESEEDSD